MFLKEVKLAPFGRASFMLLFLA